MLKQDIIIASPLKSQDGKAEANQNRLGHKPIFYFNNNVLKSENQSNSFDFKIGIHINIKQ